MNENIEFFEESLMEVDRPGIEDLLDECRQSDFYTAPASTKHHGVERGGLLKHSIEVYTSLKYKVDAYALEGEIPFESVVICGLLHDFCKKDVYKEGGEEATEKQKGYLRSLVSQTGVRLNEDISTMSKDRASDLIGHLKNSPNKKLPEKELVWSYEETEPLGHGEKSVIMLQDYIDLTERERVSIRWHMVAFNPGIHFDYPQGFAFRQAVEDYPLVTLLFTADFEVSSVMGV